MPPVPTGTPATPEQIEFNRRIRPPKESLIKARGICFEQNKFGVHRKPGAQRTAKWRAVRQIRTALLENTITLEQKVLALSSASTDPQLRIIFKSAGMVDQKKYKVYK